MRIQCYQGMIPDAYLLDPEEAHQIEVHLNGRRLRGCGAADDDPRTGYVLVYTAKSIDDVVQWEARYGAVDIIVPLELLVKITMASVLAKQP